MTIRHHAVYHALLLLGDPVLLVLVPLVVLVCLLTVIRVSRLCLDSGGRWGVLVLLEWEPTQGLFVLVGRNTFGPTEITTKIFTVFRLRVVVAAVLLLFKIVD